MTSDESTTAPTPPPPRAGRGAGAQVLASLAKWALVALALYFTWRFVAGIGWADLAARIGTASRPAIALALVVLVGRFAVWDLRFRLAAARTLGRAPRAALGFFVLLASAALNLITPSARLLGGLLRARYFARSTSRSFGLLYGVVLFDQVAHHAVMTLCTWLAVVATAVALGHVRWGLAGLALLLAVVLALAVWSRRSGPFESNPLVRFLARHAERQEGALQRFYSHGHEAVGTFVKLLAQGSLRGPALLLGLGWVLLNGLGQWLVFRAIGEPVGVLLVVAVVILGNAAGMLTGTPGGIGTTEAAMVAAFVALGVDRVDAGAGTLLFRGLHYAAVLAVGIPALICLEWRFRQGERQGGPGPREERGRGDGVPVDPGPGT